MTSDRRYYSGALSKAVTKYSCLLRSDAELLLERCETFRRNKSTAFIFNGKRFTNATACAVRIRQTGFLGLRRWQITKTLQASSRTSLKPNFMFDRTRPTIRTLCVASHWVMIKHQSCEGTIQYSSRTSRRAGKNLKRRDSGPWHGVTDTVCIAWHNTDSRMCHVLRFGGGGGGCNDGRSNDPRHVISSIEWIIGRRKDGAGHFVSTAASVQALQCTEASGWRHFEKHKASHGANRLPKIKLT
jgi:hypothetical protein